MNPFANEAKTAITICNLILSTKIDFKNLFLPLFTAEMDPRWQKTSKESKVRLI